MQMDGSDGLRWDEVLGLNAGQLKHLRQCAEQLNASGRHAEACDVWGVLEGLQPDCSSHAYERALAAHRAGNSHVFLTSSARFLSEDWGRSRAQVVELLTLRAQVLREHGDPAAARVAETGARALAGERA